MVVFSVSTVVVSILSWNRLPNDVTLSNLADAHYKGITLDDY